jgi:hypothetical protein
MWALLFHTQSGFFPSGAGPFALLSRALPWLGIRVAQAFPVGV